MQPISCRGGYEVELESGAHGSPSSVSGGTRAQQS